MLTKEQRIASRYIPKGAIKVTPKLVDAVIYLSERNGKPYAVGYVGSAGKPAFHYSFKTPERRADYIKGWLESMATSSQYSETRKTERKAFQHSLKVGDVLRTSWGYDQTNIEYFEVTAMIGATMVEVCEIAQEREDTAYMQGKCVPVPGNYIGKPLRKRVLRGNSLDIHGGFGYASLVTPTVVAGAKVYGSSHWTAYA